MFSFRNRDTNFLVTADGLMAATTFFPGFHVNISVSETEYAFVFSFAYNPGVWFNSETWGEKFIKDLNKEIGHNSVFFMSMHNRIIRQVQLSNSNITAQAFRNFNGKGDYKMQMHVVVHFPRNLILTSTGKYDYEYIKTGHLIDLRKAIIYELKEYRDNFLEVNGLDRKTIRKISKQHKYTKELKNNYYETMKLNVIDDLPF